MSYVQMDIEKIGTSLIERLCAKHNLLDPHINSDDKMLSFDGTIDIFKNFKKTGFNRYQIIDCQIKTTCTKSNRKEYISFNVEKKDLINFKLRTGVMFFYVTCDENLDNEIIYYKDFFVDKINEILEDMEYQNSKSIKFKKLKNTNSNDLYIILKKFADKKEEKLKRISSTINIDEINKMNLKNIEGTMLLKENKKTGNLSLNKNPKFFAFDKQGNKMKIIGDIKSLRINFLNNPVILKTNNKKYYETTIDYDVKNNKRVLKLSKNIILEITSKINIKINFNKNDIITNVLHDIDFLIDLYSCKKFTLTNINNINETFQIETEKNISDEINIFKQYLNTFIETCNLLDINYNLFTIPVENNFFEIISNILKKSSENTIFKVEYKNFIYPFIAMDNKSTYFFSDKIIASITKNKEHFIIPKSYYFINELDKLNLTLDDLINDINFIKDEQILNISDELNIYLLSLINTYDKTNKIKYLQAALYLSKLIYNKTNNIVDLINLAQIIYRKEANGLNNDIYIKKKIEEILELPDDNQFKFAAYTLLNKKQEATKLYKILNEDMLNCVKDYPIMKLYQELK